MSDEPPGPRRATRRKADASFFYERIIPIVLIALGVALASVVLLALWALLS